MTVTTDRATTAAPPRNLALTGARLVATLLGLAGVAGAVYFSVIAPEEAV